MKGGAGDTKKRERRRDIDPRTKAIGFCISLGTDTKTWEVEAEACRAPGATAYASVADTEKGALPAGLLNESDGRAKGSRLRSILDSERRTAWRDGGSVSRLVSRSLGRLVGWMVGYLVNWSVGGWVGGRVGSPAHVGCMSGSLWPTPR